VVELAAVSIGMAFDDARVDYIDYGSSRSLLDYEVAIWEPATLLADYRAYAQMYQGLPALTDDESFELLRDVSRVRGEMRRFLELGKTLVLFVPPRTAWHVATGAKNHSGTGKNRQTTRFVREMNVTETFPVELELVDGAGTKMKLVAGDPFSTFWRLTKSRFFYRAHVPNHPGSPTVYVDGTKLVTSAIAQVGKGTLILLPALDFAYPDYEATEDDVESETELLEYEERQAALAEAHEGFVSALLQLVRDVRVVDGDYALPEWSEALALAGERDAVKELADAEDRMAAVLEEVDAKRGSVTALRERKILFTGTGKAFERFVEQAFEALGCNVELGEVGRADRLISKGNRLAIAEMKGKNKSAAEADAAQLEKWVSEHLLENEGSEPKGILVVNGWRNTPLGERTDPPFPDQMIPYSEARNHCLITGLQLLGAWTDAEANPGDKDRIFDSIYNCVGIYPSYQDWNSFVEPVEPDATQEIEGQAQARAKAKPSAKAKAKAKPKPSAQGQAKTGEGTKS
jgi:hypothetical protein